MKVKKKIAVQLNKTSVSDSNQQLRHDLHQIGAKRAPTHSHTHTYTGCVRNSNRPWLLCRRNFLPCKGVGINFRCVREWMLRAIPVCWQTLVCFQLQPLYRAKATREKANFWFHASEILEQNVPMSECRTDCRQTVFHRKDPAYCDGFIGWCVTYHRVWLLVGT